MTDVAPPCVCSRAIAAGCDGACDMASIAQQMAAPAEKKEQGAAGFRREQIASLARPSRLAASAVDIKEEVAQVRETNDLWKVYRPEWIRTFSSKAVGEAGKTECEKHFEEKYKGKVSADDVRYMPTSAANPDKYPWRLELKLPNIKGEFKTKDLAESYRASKEWDDAVLVSRNSKAEHDLKAYSKKAYKGK